MAFNPNLTATDSELKSAEMREQFNGLKDLIDAIPAPPPETDPVFAASEAALLVAGDKAKLDAAVQPGAPVSALDNDAGYLTSDALAGSPVSQFANDAGYVPARQAPFVAANLPLVIAGSGFADPDLNQKFYAVFPVPVTDAEGIILPIYASADRRVAICWLIANSIARMYAKTHNVISDTFAESQVPDISPTAIGFSQSAGNGSFTVVPLSFTPAAAGHWDSASPASLAAAIDRLAALASNNGATPIP